MGCTNVKSITLRESGSTPLNLATIVATSKSWILLENGADPYVENDLGMKRLRFMRSSVHFRCMHTQHEDNWAGDGCFIFVWVNVILVENATKISFREYFYICFNKTKIK